MMFLPGPERFLLYFGLESGAGTQYTDRDGNLQMLHPLSARREYRGPGKNDYTTYINAWLKTRALSFVGPNWPEELAQHVLHLLRGWMDERSIEWNTA